MVGRAQLTDETDPFFLYTLRITEEEFQTLKIDQSILVDFAEFPSKSVAPPPKPKSAPHAAFGVPVSPACSSRHPGAGWQLLRWRPSNLIPASIPEEYDFGVS